MFICYIYHCLKLDFRNKATFFLFINLAECERKSALDVNVGIITFGRENKFFRHCSNRYYSLKKSLGKYKVHENIVDYSNVKLFMAYFLCLDFLFYSISVLQHCRQNEFKIQCISFYIYKKILLFLQTNQNVAGHLHQEEVFYLPRGCLVQVPREF